MSDYEKSKEFYDFLNNDEEFYCVCCQKDISFLLSEERKKQHLERLKIGLELIICWECLEDEFCKKTNWYSHPHTSNGKKWLIEKEIKRHEDWLEHCDRYERHALDPMRMRAEKLLKFWKDLETESEK